MKNLYVSLEISYLCQFSTSFNNLTRKNNAKNNHSLLESFTEKLIHALAHLMALHSNIFMLNSWFDISPNKWHQKWRHKKLRSIVKKAQMTTSLYQSVYFWQLGCRDFISYCFGLAKFKLNSLNLIFSRVFLHCFYVFFSILLNQSGNFKLFFYMLLLVHCLKLLRIQLGLIVMLISTKVVLWWINFP